jgi:hypothetical protein
VVGRQPEQPRAGVGVGWQWGGEVFEASAASFSSA